MGSLRFSLFVMTAAATSVYSEWRRLEVVTLSGWQYRSFLTSVPSQEEQLATFHRQDTIVKIPEPGEEAEAGPWTAETEKDSIKKVRGTATPWPHCPPQVSTVLHGKASLDLRFHQWVKRAPPPVAGHLPGGPLGSCLIGIKGEFVRLDFWRSERDKEGEWGL